MSSQALHAAACLMRRGTDEPAQGNVGLEAAERSVLEMREVSQWFEQHGSL